MLCLAAGAVLVPLTTNALTLAWTHSVEKTLWEEDWRASAYGLELAQTRVRGSGAGMEPAPDARPRRRRLDMESGPAAAARNSCCAVRA